MVVLKKIRASTLMETMVATVLIIIVFMVASLVMNSLMATQINANTQPIKERLNQLEYAYLSKQLIPPYTEEWQGWQVDMIRQEGQTGGIVVLSAVHEESGRNINTALAHYE